MGVGKEEWVKKVKGLRKKPHTDNSTVIIRGKEGRGWEDRVEWGQMVIEEDLTTGGEYTIQHTDDIL